MLHYIIQVLIFQTLFLAVYDLFLKKETFFQWNRVYLIASSVFAYGIPLIKTDKAPVFFQNNLTALPQVFLNPELLFLSEVNLSSKNSNWFTLEHFYYLGIAISSLLFMYKTLLIINKINKNKVIKQKEYNLVVLKNKRTAFSFFNYLFLGEEIYNTNCPHIIAHELTHIKEKHSLDLIYFELHKIVFWFNPFSYLFQYRISALHEFIADQNTIKQKDKISFFQNLLQQTFQVEKFNFVNHFYKKSLIKQRIIMATKNKSKEILKLKYLLIIPMLLIMFMYTSCKTENEIDSNEFVEYKNLDKKPIAINSKTELLSVLGKISYKNAITSNDNEFYPIYFIISKDGKITNVDYSSVPKQYISNAENIISQLPEMNAGEKNGKKVNTKMAVFLSTKKEETQKIESLSIAIIDEAPVYKGCENEMDKKKCMSTKITKLINANFNIDVANNLGLEAGKKRISVQFIIDKNGEITDVKARAPHEILKDEAIRVMNLIPQMKPGKQKGNAVNVRYNLPIVFNIEA